jgi:hypothetical protein
VEPRTDTQQRGRCRMEFDSGWRVVDVVSGDAASTDSRANTQVDEIPQIVGLGWGSPGLRSTRFSTVFRGGPEDRHRSTSTVNLASVAETLQSRMETECLCIRVEPSTRSTKSSLMG